jgi:hypothetical protein
MSGTSPEAAKPYSDEVRLASPTGDADVWCIPFRLAA